MFNANHSESQLQRCLCHRQAQLTVRGVCIDKQPSVVSALQTSHAESIGSKGHGSLVSVASSSCGPSYFTKKVSYAYFSQHTQHRPNQLLQVPLCWLVEKQSRYCVICCFLHGRFSSDMITITATVSEHLPDHNPLRSDLCCHFTSASSSYNGICHFRLCYGWYAVLVTEML